MKYEINQGNVLIVGASQGIGLGFVRKLLGGWYGYRASKAALNMFMRNAAIEYRRTSPRTIVVMLHPGTTDTRLSQPFQKNVPAGKLFSVERTVAQLLEVDISNN